MKILNKMIFFSFFPLLSLKKTKHKTHTHKKKTNKKKNTKEKKKKKPKKTKTHLYVFPGATSSQSVFRRKSLKSGFSPFTSCAYPFYQWFCWFLQGSGHQRSCMFCLLFLMLHLGSSGRMSWQRRWQHSQSHA